MSFLQFINGSKDYVTTDIPKNKLVHVVLGNESCDLDSLASTLVLAYFLNQFFYDTPENNALVLPVINLSEEEFFTRTQSRYVLSLIGIDANTLIFRNQLDLKKIQETCNLRISLVDHHMLAKADKFLNPYVTQIIDHRPKDANFESEVHLKVQCKIKEVGSCTTLIADEIYSSCAALLSKEIATLLYYTIIYDTIGLIPENGKTKQLDIDMADKLQRDFQLSLDKKAIYDKLWEVQSDVSQFTPDQLLMRDMKLVETIPVPGFPMLVENFLKLPGAHDSVVSFAKKYGTEIVVLIGLEAKDTVKRDVAIFCSNINNKLREKIIKFFMEDTRGVSLCLKNVSLDYENYTYFQQQNTKGTRKQIIPLIKDAINSEY